ncbi:MAG: thioredoxin domain-containing protein [Gammaproteobacteria bacterium]|nr:MAG: thioredoxin domain-containing protein [Gammaproteobacteria bacterium]
MMMKMAMRWFSLLFALLLAMPVSGLENQLAGHSSPYLAMHGGDPVAWQEWRPEILDLARKQNRLIFISSGYFSCYWCHVMQRETYRNPEIAAFLNAHFIPVKVDRELNPALDAYLVDYLERTQGRAGWPLNLFLTPEGYPLIGITYLPPERFKEVVTRLAVAWEKNSDEMRQVARQALLELTADPSRPLPDPAPPQRLAQRFLRQVLAYADPLEGGFGEQNKFPMTPQLTAVLELSAKGSHRQIERWLVLTLDQMADQGLRDHLAGGFFRYTVDPSWHVPHFEKMLYTQALLVRLYLAAAERFSQPRYAAIATETLDFVLERMRGKEGLFIASLSAVDEKGEEGAVYLWQPEELDELLGKEDADLARRHWALDGAPTVEGGYLPRMGESIEALAKAEGVPASVMADRIEKIRTRLLEVRDQRGLPADTKALAGWNGLLLGALAVAGRQLGRSEYIAAARQLAQRIRERLWHGHTLWRAAEGGKPVGQASLADYAYLAEGLDLLAKAVDDATLRAWRDELVRQAWQRFHGPRGWREAEKPPLPGMGESPVLQDGALPASPAVLLRVSREAPDLAIAELAQEALGEAAPHIQEEPFWYPTWVNVLVAGESEPSRGGGSAD